MRIVGKLLKWLAILTAAAVVALAGWLWFAPPALIQVGANYSAKIVCSNVFLAGRDAEEVLALDVQAPGHPLLTIMSVDADVSEGTVRAGLFGLFGRGLAVHRSGLGCAAAPGGDRSVVADIAAPQAPPRRDVQALWPQGERAAPSQDAAIAAILDDPAMRGPEMRGLVVVQNGRIVGERYGEGFSSETPLLGWSMTKTVTAAIIGTLVKDGKLALDDTGFFPSWRNDQRGGIRLADLMAMSSGLEFNEEYGDVSDSTGMLYLYPDMAAYASAKPLVGEIGKTWSYSSGTTVMLSRIWQDAAGEGAMAWPREKLFGPLGMASAVLEPDAAGTFVGSSYLYATARDWARFGQFMLQDGVWNGERILPEGFVAWMREEAPASNGEYGRGQLWLHGPQAGTPEGQDPDSGFDLPDDAYWFLGHDGQSTVVIPSRDFVMVRMGLTPSKLGYKPQRMVEALLKVLP